MDPVVIAIANHKGGVGKTTTTHSLGRALSERGYSVLLVDMDPQSSLSEGVGLLQDQTAGRSLAEVLGGSRPGTLAMKDILVNIGERLDIAPSNLDMSLVELGLSGRLVARDSVLRKTLEPIKSRYDFILVDAPPSLGMLVINALTCADWILIPVLPQVVDIRGLALFRSTVDQLRNGSGKPAELGIVLTFFSKQFVLHRNAQQAMIDSGLHVLRTVIGRSVKVAESTETSQSILEYSPNHPRSQEYRQLCGEVLECLSIPQVKQ